VRRREEKEEDKRSMKRSPGIFVAVAQLAALFLDLDVERLAHSPVPLFPKPR
jgi:hypothetical protein